MHPFDCFVEEAGACLKLDKEKPDINPTIYFVSYGINNKFFNIEIQFT